MASICFITAIYSDYEKLGKGWMLPNLREAKILQKISGRTVH